MEAKIKLGFLFKEWVLPFLIFHLATHISLFFTTPTGTALFYLPIPLSIVLIHWLGPKVLFGLILNSCTALFFCSGDDHSLWPILVTHEAATALTSWYLFRIKFKGQIWLPDINQTLLFLFLGILIPVSINALYILFLSKSDHIFLHTEMVWAADFASSFSICLPLLYFLTPWLERRRLINTIGSSYDSIANTFKVMKKHQGQIFLSVFVLLSLSLFLPTERYWFLYGLFTIYVAIRFGFGNSLLANGIVFFITYVMPFLFTFNRDFSWALGSNLINIHLGMILLSVAACITGRVISDLRNTERKLQLQFSELERTHRELDRFVYSVSHDLSAPLKTILGLINVSRTDSDFSKKSLYIDKMEKCVVKLEGFIHEIIDYSKNSRSALLIEKVVLSKILRETVDELKDTPNFDRVSIHQDGLNVDEVLADRLRLKIILNNVISNAILYQRTHDMHEPRIWIRSESNHKFVKIQVEDNGQGIRPDVSNKIFEMFFRGTISSTGSGLGLYIAKDAAEKMNGKIEVKSTFGEGSTFTICVPKQ